MITPQDYIISFINQEHFSDNTKHMYKRHLDQFCSYLAKLKTIHLFPHKITQGMIRGYLVYMEDIGLKNISINAKFAAIRSFYKWAYKHHRVNDPTRGLYLRRKINVPPKTIREKDLQRLIKYMGQIPKSIYDKNRLRDLCVIRLFYETGAKINEIRKLKCSDINLELKKININKRTLYITNKLRASLETYINSFKRKYIFISKWKRHLTIRSIARIIVKRSKECGLSDITCTSFRDAYAYKLKQVEGITKEHIATALGLNSIESTNCNYKNFIVKE